MSTLVNPANLLNGSQRRLPIGALVFLTTRNPSNYCDNLLITCNWNSALGGHQRRWFLILAERAWNFLMSIRGLSWQHTQRSTGPVIIKTRFSDFTWIAFSAFIDFPDFLVLRILGIVSASPKLFIERSEGKLCVSARHALHEAACGELISFSIWIFNAFAAYSCSLRERQPRARYFLHSALHSFTFPMFHDRSVWLKASNRHLKE